MNTKRPLAIVIMAAGKGTRMKDPSKAKVMYEVLEKPMLHYVIELAKQLSADRIITVVGYQRDAVIQYVQSTFADVDIAIQAEQCGTGHAIMQTQPALTGFDGNVAILSGDVPLLTYNTMSELLHYHKETHADATILTADFPDPSGYGRIIRRVDGAVEKIVEHKDASASELLVKEINSGIYVLDARKLFESLQSLIPHNAQKEYYLTDVFAYFVKNQWRVQATKTSLLDEIMGVNTIEQLEVIRSVLLQRSNPKKP